jgi:hypothetical protein
MAKAPGNAAKQFKVTRQPMNDERQRHWLRGGGRPSGNMTINQTSGAQWCNKRWGHWLRELAMQKGGRQEVAAQHNREFFVAKLDRVELLHFGGRP